MEPELEKVAASRWRVALALTAVMMTTYFGFILLVAYGKARLAALVVPGLSLGMALGVGVIAVAWGLTAIYVVWANRYYDAALERAKHGTLDAAPREGDSARGDAVAEAPVAAVRP
jgi:uncharacterized membrane protein (DUF485 family)